MPRELATIGCSDTFRLPQAGVAAGASRGVRRTGLCDVERTASDYCEFGWHDQWADLPIFRLVRRNKRDYYGSEGWEFESLRAHKTKELSGHPDGRVAQDLLDVPRQAGYVGGGGVGKPSSCTVRSTTK